MMNEILTKAWEKKKLILSKKPTPKHGYLWNEVIKILITKNTGDKKKKLWKWCHSQREKK